MFLDSLGGRNLTIEVGLPFEETRVSLVKTELGHMWYMLGLAGSTGMSQIQVPGKPSPGFWKIVNIVDPWITWGVRGCRPPQS